MMRSPGSACKRFRNAAQAPEWRGTRGPVSPADPGDAAASCFLSNQRPSTVHSSNGRAHADEEIKGCPARVFWVLESTVAVVLQDNALGAFRNRLSQVHLAAKDGIV